MADGDKILGRKGPLGLAISAAVASTPGAQAQEQEVIGLEEIVVTATKRSLAIQDIPLAITAISDEEITLQRFKNFNDYVGQIPGLAVSDRQPGAKSVIMRGCAAQGLSFADTSTTSVYLDEQPVTAAGYNPDPRLVDIKRVEALAGPQGTLFGDAAQCGTLRIITNKPDTSESGGWIDVTGSSITDGGESYDVSGMANIPLIEDKLALRLVGFYADEAGWVDNVLSPTPGQQFDNSDQVKDDVNSSTWTGVRAGLRWLPTEEWTIDVGAIYQKYELDGFGDASLNQQFFEDTSVFPTFGHREQARFLDESWDDEWYQFSLTATGQLGSGTVVLTGAYFERESEYFADASAYHQAYQQLGDYFRSFNTGDPYYDTGGIYDFGGDPLSQDYDKRDNTTWSLEARYATDTDGKWSAIVGAFYGHREVEELFISNELRDYSSTEAFSYINYAGYVYYGVPLVAESNNWYSGIYDTELDQWAVFAEASVDVTENFTITAGGRYYDITNEYYVQNGTNVGLNGGIPLCGNSGLPGEDYCYGVSERQKASEDGFVPKVNLAWRWDDKMVYATYSEGFRRGGSNSARSDSLFGTPGRFPPPAGSLNAYESDELTNIEVGAKTEWMDNRVRFNISAYHMIWDNIQVQVEDPQELFALGIINFPEATIDGVEAWLSWIPSDNWSVEATLGYNNAELSEEGLLFPGTDSEVTAPDGTPLPIVPDWKGSLNLNYRFPNTWLGGEPYLLASYSYTGDSINSLAGIESSDFDAPIVPQDSWQTVDLQFGVETATWSASIFVDNVTDEEAEIFFNNRFVQQRQSLNRPRTIGVNFRRTFGADN